MKSGKLIEQGTVNEVFNNPKKQYTKDLLTASPSIQKIVNIWFSVFKPRISKETNEKRKRNLGLSKS